jgi:hypothetical protein
MHLKPTAGCQILTLIFGFGGGEPYAYSMKNCQKDSKFLCHLGPKSKVLPGRFTD